MAANLEDPSQWRLTTTNGIPYKSLGMDGEFEKVSGQVNFQIMLRSADLLAFMREMFPPSILIDGVYIPQYSRFGNTNLRVQKIGFKPYDDSLPADPFGLDTGAPAGTYADVLKVTLLYAPPEFSSNQADPTDPNSFLEVKAGVSGEFLHTTPTAVEWQALDENGDYDGDAEANRSENIPATVLAPQTSWNVKWSQIPYSYFRDVMKPTLDLMMGKVNSKPFGVLYATAPKTILLAGYDYDFQFTWNDNLLDTPLINLNLKFLEKNIIWRNVLLHDDGTPEREDDEENSDGSITHGTGDLVYGPALIRGHCDFWRPGVGWSRLLINGREVYEKIDFNALFYPELLFAEEDGEDHSVVDDEVEE